jgi:hypothetical protein
LVDDEIGHRSLRGEGLRGSPLLASGGCDEALGDKAIEDALVSEWHHARDGTTSIGHDDLLTVSHTVEVATQVVLELSDPDFHEKLQT